jgi:hypothetical protein
MNNAPMIYSDLWVKAFRINWANVAAAMAVGSIRWPVQISLSDLRSMVGNELEETWMNND